MISADEYRIKREALFSRYEDRVRQWLRENGQGELSEKIPFCRDGITCPEKWFKPDNRFRPLFILKEPSMGIKNESFLDSYLEKWGNTTCFEFAENPFDDIRIGKFKSWIRIAILASGMFSAAEGNGVTDYYSHNMSFSSGGEKYTGDIQGYIEYGERTSNRNYSNIIDRIAVMDIKKVGGGPSVTTDLSIRSQYFTKHIEPFMDLIIEQIELIDPTVIICCGRENGDCVSELLKVDGKPLSEMMNGIPWIKGYHPNRSSVQHFYTEPLKQYIGFLN